MLDSDKTPAPAEPALLLVAHGSPDPDWRRPLEALLAALADQLGEQRVALAYLSHAPTLCDGVERLCAEGHAEIVVVAALLSPGGRHVKRDIPAAVEDAQARFPGSRLRLASGALGDDPEVIEALARAALASLTR